MDTNASFVGFQTPRKQAADGDRADRIAFAELSKTPDGRSTTFESRMTLQREVDGSRSALKSQERFSDDLRRQAVAAREEAATYKAENLRLTDELRSCKARLNSALDTQEELLRKNSSMHEKLLDLQNRESKLRDDISSRDSLVEYYKTHNEKIENQLREVTQRSSSSTDSLETQVVNLQDEVAEGREIIAARNAEMEALRATTDALRAELDSHRSDRREHNDIEAELRRSVHRLDTIATSQSELRSRVSARECLLAAKEDELRGLRRTITRLSTSLNDNDLIVNRSLASRFELDRSLTAHDRLLDARLAAARARERLLDADFRGTSSVSAARALSHYYQMKNEREEAERLEALARFHRRKSYGVTDD